MPHVEFNRESRHWDELCSNQFEPLLGIVGRSNAGQCHVCVTPVESVGPCRAIWTPEQNALFVSRFSMPAWTYVGNANDEYEVIEPVGPGIFDVDYEIWENSSKALEAFPVGQVPPALLWTFTDPEDDVNCTLSERIEIFQSDQYTQPSQSFNVDEWLVLQDVTTRITSGWSNVSGHGSHSLTINIQHGMRWFAIVDGAQEVGIHRHRFEVSSRFVWAEASQPQSYWQTERLHTAVLPLVQDDTLGGYWRRPPNNVSDEVFVRAIPWSHSSTLPEISVTRRLF